MDILIVGAGPAGASLALMLAPRYRVLLVDRRAEPAQRIGESLIPAARRLFRDMRVLDAFETQGHAPYLGNRSFWGIESAYEVDFLRDPDGPGWHLDRTGFERFLRAAAQRRGADILAPARLTAVTRSGSRWSVTLATEAGSRTVAPRIVVDATGRTATVAKRLGARRRNADRLVAGWLYGTTECECGSTAGFSVIESEADGWWYSAPLPQVAGRGARVVAFHTDSDLLTAGFARDSAVLEVRLRTLPGLSPLLSRIGFKATGQSGYGAANSAVLEPVARDGWLAVGDAALSLDPLSSRGMFNALYTAMTASMACHEALMGNADAFAAYAADIARVQMSYKRHLDISYRAETRWSESPFWLRRQAG